MQTWSGANKCWYGTGRVSKSLLSFPTWGVVITPPYPTKAGALCGQRLQTSGDTPTAVSGDTRHPQPPGDASDDP